MNKFKISLLALTATLSLNAFGASIDHIQNYSAEYGANPAQQGAINVGSTVYFNPAGLMRLENGTYFVGGVQAAFGDQKMSANGKDYDTDLFSPIPNFAIYKKDDNGAFFWTLGGVGGGAALEYENGIPLPSAIPLPLPNTYISGIKNVNVKGSNMYGQMTLGRAFNLTDKWSASFGVRGVYAIRNLEASASYNIVNMSNPTSPTPIKTNISTSIDSERTASGIGVQFGLNYAPTEKLNIGFRYDSKVRLNFKTDATYDKSDILANGLLNEFYPVYRDGLKTRRDLPAIAALGASYKVTDTWTTFIGGNYYFNESATMDRVGAMNVDYDNGWEISLGSELWVNEKVAWLVGFNYAETGAPTKSYSATEYAINSTMVGTGIKYKPNETTEWTVAFNHYFYNTTSAMDSAKRNVEYSKEISSIGVNFVKKF